MAEMRTEKEKFVKSIICKLNANELNPGDRLPTESELAVQYGFSKTNIHLGIQQLEHLGFLRVVPRHAIYVNAPEHLTLEAIDALFVYLDTLPARPVIEAMLEMRRMMGMSMIRGFSKHLDPEKAAQVGPLLDDLEAAVEREDDDAREQALMNLLTFLYHNTENALFPLLMHSLRNAMTQAVHYISLYSDHRQMAAVYRSMEQHILSGDQDAATRVWSDWNAQMTHDFLHNLYGDP